MKAYALPPTTRRRKRVGRGTASGYGKTAGRGTKGQKSRTGHHQMPVYFEGGQMPLTQRIPKLRGFRNPVSRQWVSVSLGQLSELGVSNISLETLRKAGAVPRFAKYLKIIGGSKPDRALKVTAERVSAGAKKSIEAAGGSVKVTESSKKTSDSSANGPADA